ncbi:MAG: ATPase, T2SS/T4P/T4SS family [Oscillospiraceae bacterium]
MKNISGITRYFSPEIRKSLEKIIGRYGDNIHEIRLRTGRPVVLVSCGYAEYASCDGTKEKTVSDKTIYASAKDISYTFNAICDYSVHSYENEISQGYITVCGGHRVGFSGSAVINADRVSAVKYINSINFRVASQIKGCADGIMQKIFAHKPVSLLIAGEPSSGKTTVLRDLSRQLSDKYSVSVIDERGEIGAVYHGEPQNILGNMCDIFDGYPKAYGLQTAIRVMAPDIAVCDEIGDDEEVDKLLSCVNCGVKVVATAHAGSYEELIRRKNIKRLIDSNVFEYTAILDGKQNPGKISRIVKVNANGSEAYRYNNDSIGLHADGYCKIISDVQKGKKC